MFALQHSVSLSLLYTSGSAGEKTWKERKGEREVQQTFFEVVCLEGISRESARNSTFLVFFGVLCSAR